MSDLDSIASVTISSDSTEVSRAEYGTTAILAYHTAFIDDYREYSDVSEMITDGFVSTEAAYKKAAAQFQARPRPEKVVVAGNVPAVERSFTVTVTAAAIGLPVKFSIVGPTGATQDIDYVTVSATPSTTAGTIQGTISVSGVTDSVVGAVITLTNANSQFYVFAPVGCSIEETTADVGYDTVLDALEASEADWFWFVTDSGSEANRFVVAPWAATNGKKMYVGQVTASGELDDTAAGDGSATAIAATNNDNCILIDAYDPRDALDARLAALYAVQPPGSFSGNLKTLQGGTAKKRTTTQITNLNSNNVNHYTPLAGVSVLRPGKTSGGEWIDVAIGKLACMARCQEDVFAELASGSKVQFTESGLRKVAAAMEGAMQAFAGDAETPALFISDSIRVVPPKITSFSAAQKLTRIATGFKAYADYQSAINSVGLRITVTE